MSELDSIIKVDMNKIEQYWGAHIIHSHNEMAEIRIVDFLLNLEQWGFIEIPAQEGSL